MSHLLCLYKRKNAREPIARLNYSAGDERAIAIYEALAITDRNAGCSGNGTTVYVPIAQFERALNNLTAQKAERAQLQFVNMAFVAGGRGGSWLACL